MVGGVIYGARSKLPLWPTLDALTPGIAAVAVALGFSHLASGDAYGMPASIPWAIDLWGELRHPSQVYEIAAAAAILGIVLWAQRRLPYAGFGFLLWVGLTSLARLFLEAFRGDSSVLFGWARSAQVISLAVLLAAMAALHWRAKSVALEAARRQE
jgi:prolipoprotein diacylglyceryltransferase